VNATSARHWERIYQARSATEMSWYEPVPQASLDLTRARVGPAAARVEWIAADVTTFRPQRRYALWHDRAVFHFLVTATQREQYLSVLTVALAPKGHLILATFGPQGPTRCSGLPVRRYSADELGVLLGPSFQLRRHGLENHRTPTGRDQQFLWSWWQGTA
jgi:hypothetical protein